MKKKYALLKKQYDADKQRWASGQTTESNSEPLESQAVEPKRRSEKKANTIKFLVENLNKLEVDIRSSEEQRVRMEEVKELKLC